MRRWRLCCLVLCLVAAMLALLGAHPAATAGALARQLRRELYAAARKPAPEAGLAALASLAPERLVAPYGIPAAEAATVLAEARGAALYLAQQPDPASVMRATVGELRALWRQHYLRLPYRFVVRVFEPAGADPRARPLRQLLARSLGLALRFDGQRPVGSYALEVLGLGARSRKELVRARVQGAAADQTRAYLASGRVAAGTSISDGFAVPSSLDEASVTADGVVHNLGEVIVVDRRRDARLARHLEHARQLRRLPERHRSLALADYVRRLLVREGRTREETRDGLQRWTARFNAREILLGEVTATGVGICRHLALLYKVLADEAGLQVALVSGELALTDRAGRHAWNEIGYRGGSARRFLVDLLHRSPRGAFPAVDATALHAGRYRDRTSAPAYGPR